MVRLTCYGAVAIVALLSALPAPADTFVGEYSDKTAAAGKGYSYRLYRYYSPEQRAYKQHVVVYYSARPGDAYFYNPESKKYWGKCNLKNGKYALLPPEKKGPAVLNLPESAFLPPDEMPPPEVKMVDRMLPPPEVINNNRSSEPPELRQFYTNWVRDDRTRFVCHYYFKSHPFDESYKRQAVYFYPDAGKNEQVYFFNEDKQAFWGRCATPLHPLFDPEQPLWQRMPAQGPREWSKPERRDPVIPGSTDGQPIQRVPDPPFAER